MVRGKRTYLFSCVSLCLIAIASVSCKSRVFQENLAEQKAKPDSESGKYPIDRFASFASLDSETSSWLKPLFENLDWSQGSRLSLISEHLRSLDRSKVRSYFESAVGKPLDEEVEESELSLKEQRRVSFSQRTLIALFAGAGLFDVVDDLGSLSKQSLDKIILENENQLFWEGDVLFSKKTDTFQLRGATVKLHKGEMPKEIYESLMTANQVIFSVIENTFRLKNQMQNQSENSNFESEMLNSLTFQRNIEKSLIEGVFSVSQGFSNLLKEWPLNAKNEPTAKTLSEIVSQIVNSRVLLQMARERFGVLASAERFEEWPSGAAARAMLFDDGKVAVPDFFKKRSLEKREKKILTLKYRDRYITEMGCPVAVRVPLFTQQGFKLSNEPPLHEFNLEYLKILKYILEKNGLDEFVEK